MKQIVVERLAMSSNPGSRIDCIKCLLCIQKPCSRLMIVLGNYYKHERIPNFLLGPQNCCIFSKMMRLYASGSIIRYSTVAYKYKP